MSMFCYQCQETARNVGCTVSGVCGKKPEIAGIQDLLIYSLKGVSKAALADGSASAKTRAGRIVVEGLFATITNANFDDGKLKVYIRKALALRDELAGGNGPEVLL